VITYVCRFLIHELFIVTCNFSLLEFTSNCHIGDPILNELLAVTTLYSDIVFIIRYEVIDFHDGLQQLFLALSTRSRDGFQSICVATLNVIGEVWNSITHSSHMCTITWTLASRWTVTACSCRNICRFQSTLAASATLNGTEKLSGLIEVLLQQHRLFPQPAGDFSIQ
jgi:hypothetical protein